MGWRGWFVREFWVINRGFFIFVGLEFSFVVRGSLGFVVIRLLRR